MNEALDSAQVYGPNVSGEKALPCLLIQIISSPQNFITVCCTIVRASESKHTQASRSRSSEAHPNFEQENVPIESE